MHAGAKAHERGQLIAAQVEVPRGLLSSEPLALRLARGAANDARYGGALGRREPVVVDGEAALSALEAFARAPASGPLAAQHAGIARMVGWLGGAGIDIGDPLAQQLLDALAATGVLAPASVAKIKALAQAPAPVGASEISEAVRGE